MHEHELSKIIIITVKLHPTVVDSYVYGTTIDMYLCVFAVHFVGHRAGHILGTYGMRGNLENSHSCPQKVLQLNAAIIKYKTLWKYNN